MTVLTGWAQHSSLSVQPWTEYYQLICCGVSYAHVVATTVYLYLQ